MTLSTRLRIAAFAPLALALVVGTGLLCSNRAIRNAMASLRSVRSNTKLVIATGDFTHW